MAIRRIYHLRVTISCLLLLSGVLAFQDSLQAAPKAYLKINNYYVVYTYPIIPYLNSHGDFIVSLLPACELLGMKCHIGTKSAVVTQGSITVRFTAGSDIAKVNGLPLRMNASAFSMASPKYTLMYDPSDYLFSYGNSHPNQMLVPLSILIQAFHLKTEYNASLRTTKIDNAGIPDVDGTMWAENIRRFEGASTVGSLMLRSINIVKKVKTQKITSGQHKTNYYLSVTVQNNSEVTIPTGQAFINLIGEGDQWGLGFPMSTTDIRVPLPPAVGAHNFLEKSYPLSTLSSTYPGYILMWLIQK